MEPVARHRRGTDGPFVSSQNPRADAATDARSARGSGNGEPANGGALGIGEADPDRLPTDAYRRRRTSRWLDWLGSAATGSADRETAGSSRRPPPARRSGRYERWSEVLRQ